MESWQTAATFLLAATLAGCSHSVADSGSAAEEEEHHEAAVTVRAEPARVQTLAETVDALAQCEAPIDKLAMVTPLIEGHVKSILVEHGARVKAGQALVELDPKLPAADLAEKVAARDAAKAALAFLLSLPREEEQDISKLVIDQARAALQRVQSQLKHLEPLAQRNEVSPQQLVDVEKAVEQARLQQESAEAQFRLSMSGPRPESADEAKARLQIAERAVETSQARLDFHTLRAPIDGVLQELACHPGQTVAVGTSLGEIVDSRQLQALAWLPVGKAQWVRKGQKATVMLVPAVTSGAADSSSDEPAELAAEVIFVGQIADPQTGNLPIRCLVDNHDGKLAVGQTVQISITVREEHSVLCVPLAAVFDLGEGPVVNVIRDGKTEELHPKLGQAHGGWVAILDSDLKEGEPLIVEGGYNLKDGTPVNVEPTEHTDEPTDAA